MRTFVMIWVGQLVSLLGTGMTRFALMIWAWQTTGEATTLALLGFFAHIPYVLISPFAGMVVDRYNRRIVMIVTDLCAGCATIGLLALFLTGNLRIWHLYLAETLMSVCEAFQVPAYAASISMLVPKEQYGRVNGMRSLAESTSTVLAPILAAALLAFIDLDGVMLIDVVTFLVAVGILLCVRIPHPTSTTPHAELHSSTFTKLSVGFRYIFARPGLTGLMFIFAGINLFAALTYFSILPAMILARTGSDKIALATVQGALGIGGVVGGLVISLWGGPRKRVHACLAGAAISFLIGDFLLAIGRSVPVWSLAAFLAAVFIPFIVAAERSIWQSKVPPDIQGRVFSSKNMLQLASLPLGYALAGPLADRVFEPAMAAGGLLAGTFGRLVGTGPGAGIAMMFVCTSVLGMLMSVSGYLFPAIRNVETELPDHTVDVNARVLHT